MQRPCGRMEHGEFEFMSDDEMQGKPGEVGRILGNMLRIGGH